MSERLWKEKPGTGKGRLVRTWGCSTIEFDAFVQTTRPDYRGSEGAGKEDNCDKKDGCLLHEENVTKRPAEGKKKQLKDRNDHRV